MPDMKPADTARVAADEPLGDGSVVINRVSQTLGRLYMQTQIAEELVAKPGEELSNDVRSLPLWQLQSMIDEVANTRRELDNAARRLGIVEVMIREQASGIVNHDPMAAEPVRDYAVEAQQAARLHLTGVYGL